MRHRRASTSTPARPPGRRSSASADPRGRAAVLRTPTARVLDEARRARPCTGCSRPTRSRPASLAGRVEAAGHRRRRRWARRSGASARGGELDAVCLRRRQPDPVRRARRRARRGRAFAERARRAGRRCSTIVGPAAVGRAAVGAARARTGARPATTGRASRCMAIDGPPAVAAEPRVRPVRPRRARDPAARRASRCSPRRSASARCGSTAAPATAPGSPSWCGPGSRWPGSRTARCCSRPRSARSSRAACQVQGVWVAPALPRPGHRHGGHRGRRRVRPHDDRAGRQPVRQRLQRRRPGRLPPGRLPRGRAVRQRAVLTAPSGGSRRAQRGVRGRGPALTICAPCGHDGAPPSLTALLIAVPVLAACSGSAEDDVARRRAGVPRRLGRRRHRRRRRGRPPTPTRPPRCWSRPPTDLPDATLTAELGKVTVDGRHGHRRLDRHLGPRRRARLELRRHAAAPGGRRRLAGRRRADASCTRSWARGSTWC